MRRLIDVACLSWSWIDITEHPLSGALSSREHLPGKGSNSPAHAHRRCWPAILRTLTRITSVPGCAVSSVGFLWGSGTVSRRCGVSVGLAEAPDWPGRRDTGTQVPRLPDPDDRFPSNPASPERPAACGDSAPNADFARLRSGLVRQVAARRSSNLDVRLPDRGRRTGRRRERTGLRCCAIHEDLYSRFPRST